MARIQNPLIMKNRVHLHSKESAKGALMKENLKPANIEQLLAEADELIRQIKSDAINDMQEEHIIQFEKHTQNLNKIKSKVQSSTEKRGTWDKGSAAEGTHEAIQDILKAMRGLTKDLS